MMYLTKSKMLLTERSKYKAWKKLWWKWNFRIQRCSNWRKTKHKLRSRNRWQLKRGRLKLNPMPHKWSVLRNQRTKTPIWHQWAKPLTSENNQVLQWIASRWNQLLQRTTWMTLALLVLSWRIKKYLVSEKILISITHATVYSALACGCRNLYRMQNHEFCLQNS